jgi:Fur family ferric uptake transcriptional regulator
MAAHRPSRSIHGTTEEAIVRLEQSPLRHTKTREAILEVMVKRHGPFSAEELKDAVKGQKLDTVTVYRTLASFEQAGLVRRCDFGDGVSRYEFQCEHEHHHHIICRSCRKIENIDDCTIQELEQMVKKKGFAEITHTLEFFGICKACRTA